MSGISRTYNLNYDRTVDLLARGLNSHSEFQDFVRIRYVLVESDKKWHVPIITASVLTRSEERPTAKNELDYGSTRLCEDLIPIDAFVECVRTKRLELSKMCFVLKTNQGAERTYHSSNNSFHRNPGHLYILGWQESVTYTRPDLLLSHDLPYYPDLVSAIREWTGLSGYSDSHSYSGKLLLFIPECRAYINKLDRSGENLRISICRSSRDLQRLRVKGAYWIHMHDAKYERIDAAIPPADVVELHIAEDASRLELFLIGPDETLYDYHLEGRWPTEGIASVLSGDQTRSSDEKLVEQAIQSGEGMGVEFKPYLDPDNRKRDELIRTVVAFANKQGGTVLIGVDNDCRVTGVERELTNRYRERTGDLVQCISMYQGEILQLINARVVPDADVKLSTIPFAGHRVLLIKVPEGQVKPYRDVQGENLYIRRGASNVQPNNEELKALISTTEETKFSWRNA